MAIGTGSVVGIGVHRLSVADGPDQQPQRPFRVVSELRTRSQQPLQIGTATCMAVAGCGVLHLDPCTGVNGQIRRRCARIGCGQRQGAQGSRGGRRHIEGGSGVRLFVF